MFDPDKYYIKTTTNKNGDKITTINSKLSAEFLGTRGFIVAMLIILIGVAYTFKICLRIFNM